MGKLFEFDARQGSYIDRVSGEYCQNTDGIFVRNDKGSAWKSDGLTTKITTPSSYTLSRTSSSIITWWKLSKVSSVNFIIGNSVWSNLANMRIATAIFDVESNTNSDFWSYISNAIEINKFYCVHVVADESSVKTYFDGVEVDDNNPTDDLTIDQIGSAGSSEGFAEITKVAFYDRPLTEKERVIDVKDFLRSTPTTKIIQ